MTTTTETTTRFAAIDQGQPTGAVYGIGRTEEEALADARRGAADGEYEVVPMTAGAYALVDEQGGAPSAELTVSRGGVSLRSEER